MIEKQIELQLPEGKFDCNVLEYKESDRRFLFEIYKDWRALSEKLLKIKSRAINLPEGLSESAFCVEMNSVRMIKGIPGANTSFDCYDPVLKHRIQIKACSVLPDLTSFGPRSVWDKIYFIDFYREGKWDGSFDIYPIKTEYIYKHKVNSNETFLDHQKQGRRPRFSIFTKLIQVNSITPIKTGYLNP